MNPDFVKVFTTNDQIEGGIIASMLQEKDIKAVLMNKQDSAYVSIGEIELYVPAIDFDRALRLIEDLQSQDR